MADLTGPFDTGSWAMTEWYNFAPTWAPSGIIGTPAASVGAGDFAVTASGLTLTVACNGDRVWIDGSGYKPDTDKTLPVTANGTASLSRRDRIVVRRDLAAKTTAVVRLAGTPAGTPAPPALTQTTGGIYEIPVCSFLVPPNNGTALTGFIDERGWLTDSSGTVGFGSIAARDAYFPSPAQGQTCHVAGVRHTYDGTGWRYFLTGAATGSCDASGFLSFPHGGGKTPQRWGASLPSQATDAINVAVGVLGWSSDATNLTARFVRYDTNTYFGTSPMTCVWWAQF